MATIWVVLLVSALAATAPVQGRHAALAFVNMSTGTSVAKAGEVKAFASRTERGFSVLDVASYSDFAPAGMLPAIVDRLARALHTAVARPDRRGPDPRREVDSRRDRLTLPFRR